MFAVRMRGDTVLPGWDSQPPTWERIESAVRWLDGDSLTALMVFGPGLACAAVGGGGGHYCVDVSFDDRTWYHLVTPTAADEEVEFIAGGQRVRKPLRDVAGLEDTLHALRAFAVEGRMDEALAWECG